VAALKVLVWTMTIALPDGGGHLESDGVRSHRGRRRRGRLEKRRRSTLTSSSSTYDAGIMGTEVCGCESEPETAAIPVFS